MYIYIYICIYVLCMVSEPLYVRLWKWPPRRGAWRPGIYIYIYIYMYRERDREREREIESYL